MKGSVKRRLAAQMKDRDRRIRRLLVKGLISDPSEIPNNAIPIDPDCSTKSQVWSPEVFYQDLEFSCADCGKSECWSAESQQHYFEVIQAIPYKQPKRCYDCRQKEHLRREKARIDAGHATQEVEGTAPNRSLPQSKKSIS
jgi:hypothetical protein